MKLVAKFQIKAKSPFERKHLLALRTDHRLKAGAHLVYIYELDESEPAINYPCRSGRALYIGEACRQTLPSGGRFGQHVSTTLAAGSDPGTNFTLSQYYHRGAALVLTIYEVTNQERKQRERDFLICHLRTFGALPIAQGACGENFTIIAVRDRAVQLPSEVLDTHFS